jgi:hypothetical protein
MLLTKLLSQLPLSRDPNPHLLCAHWMSSSADSKPVKNKNSRVGPPVESEQLKALKAKQRADQEARTEALVAEYKDFGPDPTVDLYQVGRAQVLSASSYATTAEPSTETNSAHIDLAESAGSWKGERRPFGLVLTRGFGELLVLTESPSHPGVWVVKYDPPFPEEETALYPE